MRALISFGKYLQEKRNFIRVGAVGFGVPFAVAALWMVGGHGDVGWWLFVVVVALAAGWVWASLMWLVYKNDIQKRMSSQQPPEK